MTDLKVVPIKRDGYSDAIDALKNIIAQLESGEIEPCETGCVVLMGKNGTLDTLGFGPKSDDLQVIGLLEMGKQVILEAAMYPDV
ncbi:hypothetical protein DK254_00255 [Pseudomonas sp. RW407]|uniref:hypothetical protein n=1 Tax=Pseudomonas sp. RW407 TaxID=2202894 RepID=UPI000D6F38DD|nr:hypothetical protein [Pseudomonas sp. RW407]PWU30719.1 hypothetical protein DK254_11675 [Pseudomonas sp. RW407]PWU32152.1 hypothetical protein DK254_00255 [Pseudomonas sp. RW407]